MRNNHDYTSILWSHVMSAIEWKRQQFLHVYVALNISSSVRYIGAIAWITRAYAQLYRINAGLFSIKSIVFKWWVVSICGRILRGIWLIRLKVKPSIWLMLSEGFIEYYEALWALMLGAYCYFHWLKCRHWFDKQEHLINRMIQIFAGFAEYLLEVCGRMFCVDTAYCVACIERQIHANQTCNVRRIHALVACIGRMFDAILHPRSCLPCMHETHKDSLCASMNVQVLHASISFGLQF